MRDYNLSSMPAGIAKTVLSALDAAAIALDQSQPKASAAYPEPAERHADALKEVLRAIRDLSGYIWPDDGAQAGAEAGKTKLPFEEVPTRVLDPIVRYWFGLENSDGRMDGGPFDTIGEAEHSAKGYGYDAGETVNIITGTQNYRLADWIGDDFLEYLGEVYELSADLHEDDDGKFECSPEQAQDLVIRFGRAANEWQLTHGLRFTGYTIHNVKETLVYTIGDDGTLTPYTADEEAKAHVEGGEG